MKTFNLILSLLLLFSVKLSAQVNKPIPEADSVYQIVDIEAEPVGGKPTFYGVLITTINSLQYSQETKNNLDRIDQFFIEFIVEKDGSVSYAKPLEGREAGNGWDEAVIKVIKEIKWKPAQRNGKIVRSMQILPMRICFGK